MYDKKWLHTVQFSVPTIAVGNLSTGGTGKTPHIEHLIELLQSHYSIATLSRGYGRKTRGFILADTSSTAEDIGDEPMQFFTKYPHISVAVGEQRIVALPQLLRHRAQTDLVLLDDAFQHRPIQPGLNILLSDYHRPFYQDWLLPLGRLRESRQGYQRADIIIITKCPPNLSPEEQTQIIRKIKPLPNQEVFFSHIEYQDLQYYPQRSPASIAKHQAVALLSGIANPQPLLDYLRCLSQKVSPIYYPDHHRYSSDDISRIIERCQRHNIEHIITTEKDAMRLIPHIHTINQSGIHLLVLPIKMRFIQDEHKFATKVLSYVERALKEYKS